MNGPVQPDYITYDIKGREAFLSQVGSMTPSERELFHRLIKMWAPEINYNTFFGIVSAESVSAKNDIESMMRKLRHAKIGLLTTTIREGARVPQSIVLTNPDDFFFHMKVVEEELVEVVADISLPLPSVQSFQEKNLSVPAGLITDCSFLDLATMYGQKEITDLAILRLDVKNAQLLVSNQNIKRYMTVALAKMQNYLLNSNFLSWCAQMKNMALADLKRSIDAREPAFLAQFTKDILARQDEIRQNRKLNADESFWSVLYFMHHFLTNQIEETKRRKAAEEERLLDMKTIAEQVKAEPSFLMTEERFAELLLSHKKKYDKAFPEFKKDFEDKYLQAPEKKSLPVLVHLSRFYLHQENVHAFFLTGLEKNGRDLLPVYVHLMERYIKNPANSIITAFYTPDNFQNDIGDHIKEMDPLLHALLQRPNLVAEAIILSVRKHKEAKSTDDLKATLAPFFHGDKLQFRDNSVLFGLNIIAIFKLAFVKCSIIRQLILKISGKYESLHKKFGEFIETSYSDEIRKDKASPREEPEVEMDPVKKKQAAKERAEEAAARQRRAAKEAAKAAPASNKPASQKLYSKDERDGAWSQFGKTLKK